MEKIIERLVTITFPQDLWGIKPDLTLAEIIKLRKTNENTVFQINQNKQDVILLRKTTYNSNKNIRFFMRGLL